LSDANSIWVRYLPSFLRNDLRGRRNLQKVIANTGWLFADKILRLGVGLVVGVWVARFLGPESFGAFSYATAFVSLFSALVTLGLDGVVVRDLVSNPEHTDRILGSAFVLKLAGGSLAFVLALAAIFLMDPADSLSHWLVAIIAAGMIFQAFDAVDFWFQARVEARFAVYAKNSAFLLVSILKIVLILMHAGLLAFAFAASLEVVLGAVGLVVAYRISGEHILRWRANTQWVRNLIKDGWPLALAGIAVVIYMKIDQVMLGQMLGNQAVGIYSAATRISEVWYFIPISIVASVSPSLVEARKISAALYYERLAKLFRLMAGVALAIAVPMTFASGIVASALYGSAYDGVGPILSIHIWAALFVFLGVAQNPWTINEGMTKLAFLRTSLGALANILLNIVLIPRYGPIGAAIATTVSYALSAVVMNAFNKKTRNIFLLQVKSIVGMVPGKG